MSSITADPPIAMTHRSDNACTSTSQIFWLLRRESYFALETGQRGAPAAVHGREAKISMDYR
jgi:hypothetical protein